MGHIDRETTMTHSTALFALFAALLCASSYCEVSEEVSGDIVPENGLAAIFADHSDSLIQDLKDDSPVPHRRSDDDLVQSKERWTRRLTPPGSFHQLKLCAQKYCKPIQRNMKVSCRGGSRAAYLVAINCLIGTLRWRGGSTS